MLPNLFLNIGAVHRKASTTTPNVLETSKTITANVTKNAFAINAKVFTVHDLALNANIFKSWTLIFIFAHHLRTKEGIGVVFVGVSSFPKTLVALMTILSFITLVASSSKFVGKVDYQNNSNSCMISVYR